MFFHEQLARSLATTSMTSENVFVDLAAELRKGAHGVELSSLFPETYASRTSAADGAHLELTPKGKESFAARPRSRPS